MRIVLKTMILMLLIASCGGDTATVDNRPRVVATSSIVGDLVGLVAGDNADVEVLMPVGVDPHDFDASARQMGTMLDADLVVGVGLGLEEGIQDALDSVVEAGVPLILIGPQVDPLPLNKTYDPHVWMDPIRMVTAVQLIDEQLSGLFPEVPWEGDQAVEGLEALHQNLGQVLDSIPPENRKLLTGHQALGYFADRYGFEVIGAVIPSVTTLSEVSASDFAGLIDSLRRSGVPAVFADAHEPEKLLIRLAEEADGVEVVELFVGSLGERGSGAETYMEMMELNGRRIAEGLR